MNDHFDDESKKAREELERIIAAHTPENYARIKLKASSHGFRVDQEEEDEVCGFCITLPSGDAMAGVCLADIDRYLDEVFSRKS
tara:strand:- start:6622 stop:6873 length:252 start_codon:yes stop_codon:yes gene_type:complete